MAQLVIILIYREINDAPSCHDEISSKLNYRIQISILWQGRKYYQGGTLSTAYISIFMKLFMPNSFEMLSELQV